MAWGILEDKHMANVPGTTLMSDMDDSALAVSDATKHLQHRDGVILIPQPSNSPNDPLNFSNRRKDLILGLLAIALTTTISATGLIGVAIKWLVVDFHANYQDVIRELSVPKVIAATVAFFFASAVSAVWGKRVQFVLCGFAIVIVQLVAYWYNSLIYLTVIGGFQGVLAAPIEMLLGATVTDLYFVHERARKLAFIGTLSIIGGEVGAVLSSQIIDKDRKNGIRKAFLISACVMLPVMLLVYFYCPETTYNKRQIQLEKDFQNHDIVPEKLEQSSSSQVDVIDNKDAKDVQVTHRAVSADGGEAAAPVEARYPLRQRLAVFNGRVTDRSFFKSILQPFPLMLFPSVVFSTVVNGAYGTWGVFSGYIIYQAFAEIPFNFTPGELGLIGIPGTIVVLIFNIVAGSFCDWSVKYMARKNKGIYEPEYRLLMMIPAIIFSTLAFVGQGWIMQQSFDWKTAATASYMDPFKKTPMPAPFEVKPHLIKLIVFSMGHFVAGPFASAAALTYILDCQQKNATEAFVATTLFKSVFVMAAVLTANGWYVAVGPKKVFDTLAIANVAVASLTIPMYIFGKRFRAMVARSNFLTRVTKVA